MSADQARISQLQNQVKQLKNNIKRNRRISNSRKYVNNRRFSRRRARNRLINRFTYSSVDRTRAPTNTGFTLTPYSQILSVQKGKARLQFCELFPIFQLDSLFNGLTVNIPFNPSKWRLTRTYTQCSIYSQFRPIQLRMRYVPVVPTDTRGTISLGVIYHEALPEYTPDLASTLPQYEAGFITSVWKEHDVNIPLGTRLFQNAYSLADVTKEDIPFRIIGQSGNTLDDQIKTGAQFGYIALYGLIDLSGPRTVQEVNVSGNFKGIPIIPNTNADDTTSVVYLDISPDTVSGLSEGTTFEALVTGYVEPTQSSNVNWKKIFKTFANVVCTVINVTTTLIRIAIVVAPIIGLVSNDSIPEVSFQVIGKRPNVDF